MGYAEKTSISECLSNCVDIFCTDLAHGDAWVVVDVIGEIFMQVNLVGYQEVEYMV